jgi:hypothetical protein
MKGKMEAASPFPALHLPVLHRLHVFMLEFLLLAGLALTPAVAAAGTPYALRGYRTFTELPVVDTPSVEVRSFEFESPERAQIFASKIYSDYALTQGNTLSPLATARGPADAISLGGEGLIIPLILHDSRRVSVLIGNDAGALTARANQLLDAPPLRAADVTHPLFMDKWDRYCMGVWNRFSDVLGDPTHKTPESYYGWLAQIGLNPQLVDATNSDDLTVNDNLLRMLRKYFKAAGTKYQNVEWLQAVPDLYNRNPFLSSFDGPGTMTKWDYYGETPHAPGLLRDVQHAPILQELRDYTRDDNLMAILDADGEVGPFPYFKWGEYGPVQTRNFVRYLQEERHFSLADVSKRYYGRVDALKSWTDVTLADWRTFYGWDDKSVDLQGEWRVMREGDSPGVREGWPSPSFDDSDWIRLTYPGDTTLFTLPDGGNPKPLWMRRTLTVDPSKFPGKIYLSVAPLGEQPVQVFLDGKRLGILAPRFHTGRIFGQFDVTAQVRANPQLTVALRFESNDLPNGPVFLTDKPLEDFPTSDPLLNARRYDHFDFIDWAVADSVGTMLREDRGVDPDRAIKVHAYDSSAWGYRVTSEYGGYSHHTGAGAGWSYTVPKQYDLTRGTQDSAETGGSQDTPRNIKGLIGNLIFMGKNAHDYFYNLQDITKDPAVLDWWVKRLPDMRVMGRENVDASPIACIRGLRNSHYVGEFYKTENWRFGYDLTKGGEMTPLLDELRIGEGRLPYPAIVDEGTVVWDEAMTAALKQYVADGGMLFLEAASGLHSPVVRDAHPAAELAGVRIAGDSQASMEVTLTVADPVFGNRTGDVGRCDSHLMSAPHVIVPGPGVDVIGTTDHGQPAITRRKIGKGAVYYCAGGLWPGGIREAIRDHFVPPVYATVEDGPQGRGVDLYRTAQSNNGCEDLLMCRGLGKPATVHWTFDYTPAAIYNPVTGAAIAAKIDGHTATFGINIDDWDFAWFAARRPDARAQFAHWFTRQTQMWHGLVKGEAAPTPPLFRSLDLNRGWKLAQTDSLTGAQALMKLDDAHAGLKDTDLGWWSAPGTGLKHGPGVFGLYRRDFRLPAGWEKNATLALNIDGRVYAWPQPGFGGPSTIYLNGTQIWTGAKIDDAVSLDLTAAIRPGANRLEIVHEGEGILASMQLVRTINPDATLDLAGNWQAVDGLQAVHTVQLPGKVKTSFVYRDIVVPREQAGREVWLRVTSGDLNSSRGVIINGRNRYPVTRADNSRPMEVNITPEIRFGEMNRILIGTGSMDGWNLAQLDYQKLELGFYAPGRWNGDGRGIAAALTPRELSDVASQEARVQLFPLVQNAKAKPPVNLFPFASADAQAYTPPPPAVDLDLDGAAGVTDRGSAHATVQVEGKTAPFIERAGAVKGLQFFGQGDVKSDLLLPEATMGPLLAGKNFTMCAWLKPMLDTEPEGDLAQWGLAFDWTMTERGTTVTWNDASEPRLAAGDILTSRRWHFLAVSAEGSHATLYVDGVNVADQIFAGPLGNGNTSFVIGGNARYPHFLSMKLAAFTVYPQALDDDSVGKLFVKDRDRYLGAPGTVWPEDALARLQFSTDGVKDLAEFPATLTLGSGTTPQTADGHAVLDFDGKTSSLSFKENAHVHLLGAPFSLIIDLKPAPGAEGCVFRRVFNPGLWVRKDGSVLFDADSGENSQITVPNAVTAGQWNRLMLTFDGKTFSLFRDGKMIAHQPYIGAMDSNENWPFCVGADASAGGPAYGNHLAMQVRELTIYSGVLEAVPPAAPAGP